MTLSVGYASVTFKINTINQKFPVKKRRNKNSKYGRMKLTTMQ